MTSEAMFHLLGQDDEKEMQHGFFDKVMPLASASVIQMPMVPSMVPLHLFSQDNKNEVQPKFFYCVIPLMLVSLSHDANSVIIGTIPFVRSR